MKVKTVKPFLDKKAGVTRNLGDAFAISEERYKEINSTKFGILVETVTEETVRPKKGKSKSKSR